MAESSGNISSRMARKTPSQSRASCRMATQRSRLSRGAPRAKKQARAKIGMTASQYNSIVDDERLDKATPTSASSSMTT
jgi:hypothetical protein